MYSNDYSKTKRLMEQTARDVLKSKASIQAIAEKKGDLENMEDIPYSKFEFSYNLVLKMKSKRKELNMSQVELARLSRVNRTTISKIESFQRLIVNLDVILRILDVLGLKMTIVDEKYD